MMILFMIITSTLEEDQLLKAYNYISFVRFCIFCHGA